MSAVALGAIEPFGDQELIVLNTGGEKPWTTIGAALAQA
jgi:lipopolysaccharide biosynthesis glycosyltransferase